MCVCVFLCCVGKLRQECDRTAAVRQKEQAQPPHSEQTPRGDEETGSREGEMSLFFLIAQNSNCWQISVT